MPRIWADTMDTHRRQVNDAILDATARLVAEHGPMSVAMSAIAERAGIGRATLYKYFPDVEAILVAWHTRDFAGHLDQLKALTEAEHVTLDDVAAFVRAQRRRHTRAKEDHLVGNLAHTLAAEGSFKDAIEHEIIAALTSLMTRLARRKEVRRDHEPELLAGWLLHAIHAPTDLDDTAISELVVDALAPKPKQRSRASAR
ncbi:MAG: TetR/AcrR family transcriptional regulator [Acidimicrobiales bacterium]